MQEANDAVLSLTEQLAGKEGELAAAGEREAALRAQLATAAAAEEQRTARLAELEVRAVSGWRRCRVEV